MPPRDQASAPPTEPPTGLEPFDPTEHAETGDHEVPTDLLELHEILEYQAAVEAES